MTKFVSRSIVCAKHKKYSDIIGVTENTNSNASPNERRCVFACIGRALEWHSRGQEFDPLRLHHSTSNNYFFARF